MKKIEKLYKDYKHAIPLILYGIIYLSWFTYLEGTVTRHYSVIHMTIDDYIPFCELFVIPYFLWFLYVAVTILFLFFKDKKGYYQACAFLFTGMTIFLIVSTLWPNGHHLRPFVMPRDNILTRMVASLYRTDTATNLWPSIHCYNSLGAHFALSKCAKLKNHKWILRGSFVLCWSIILATVFIKQHSVFDMLTAFAMAFVMYTLVYRFDLIVSLKAKLIGSRKEKVSDRMKTVL